MGCDIHAMIEARVDPYKLKETIGDMAGWWMSAGELHIERNYELFAQLADVRNREGITPHDVPRGMPDEPSSVYEAWVGSWGIDGHSHSWYTLAEIKNIKGLEYTKNVLKKIERHMELVQRGWEASDVRIVFFFDN